MAEATSLPRPNGGADADRRQRDGSPADAKFTAVHASALGGILGLAVGLTDWLLIDSYAGGHWHWIPPTKQLVETAGPVALLPLALWLGQLLGLIGRIILNPLKKAAGPETDL